MSSNQGCKIGCVEGLVGGIIFVSLIILCWHELVVELKLLKNNASAGDAHYLGTACSDYNNENGHYPAAASSTEAFKLLYPTYLQDPGSLYLWPRRGHRPYEGDTIAGLKKENVCWTLTMNKYAGLTGKDPYNLPLLLSDLGGDYPSFPSGVTTVILDPDKNIWGADGVTVAYLDMSTIYRRPGWMSRKVTLTARDFEAPPDAHYAAVAP